MRCRMSDVLRLDTTKHLNERNIKIRDLFRRVYLLETAVAEEVLYSVPSMIVRLL